MSRLWGLVADLPVPKIVMPHILSVYSMFYGCNLNEVDMDNSTTTASKGSVIPPSKKVYYFRTIQDFFTRRIYPECRPLAPTDAVSILDLLSLFIDIRSTSDRHQIDIRSTILTREMLKR